MRHTGHTHDPQPPAPAAPAAPAGGAAEAAAAPDRAAPPQRPLWSAEEAERAIGRRACVWYVEAQSDRAAAHRGTVTFARANAFFLHLDVALGAKGEVGARDGVWVVASDDWAWEEGDTVATAAAVAATAAADATPAARESGDPRAEDGASSAGRSRAPRVCLPVAEQWGGCEARAVDGIFRARGVGGTQQLLVKWKGEAHIHAQWVPRAALEVEPTNRRRVQRFIGEIESMRARADAAADGVLLLEDEAAGEEEDGETGDEPFNPEFTRVERVVATAAALDGSAPQYLVKWAALPYSACTWEAPLQLVGARDAVASFEARRAAAAAPPSAEAARTERRIGDDPSHGGFVRLAASPTYPGGNELRSYQLEGLNWLLFSWYARRSVMLADEMGLGKTAQSVAVLDHLSRREGLRGPFLVVAPLSTLQHWRREFEHWSGLDAVVYHGDRASRELIRKLEFRDGAEAAREVAPPRRAASAATSAATSVVASAAASLESDEREATMATAAEAVELTAEAAAGAAAGATAEAAAEAMEEEAAAAAAEASASAAGGVKGAATHQISAHQIEISSQEIVFHEVPSSAAYRPRWQRRCGLCVACSREPCGECAACGQTGSGACRALCMRRQCAHRVDLDRIFQQAGARTHTRAQCTTRAHAPSTYAQAPSHSRTTARTDARTHLHRHAR